MPKAPFDVFAPEATGQAAQTWRPCAVSSVLVAERPAADRTNGPVMIRGAICGVTPPRRRSRRPPVTREAAMKSIQLAAVATVSLAACSGRSMTEAQQAPEPRKRIDVQRFYTGIWHEIARHPMTITDGCVAGATEYGSDRAGAIQVLDSCRMGSPRGELKTVGGPGTILDPGFNAKLRVDYKL